MAESLNSLIYQILSGQFPKPSALVPGIPAPLENVLLKSLALEADERFTTAAEFRAALLGERVVEPPVIRQAIPSSGATPADGLLPTLPQEAGMVTPVFGSTPGPGSAASPSAQFVQTGQTPQSAEIHPRPQPSARPWLLPVVIAAVVVAATVGLGIVFLGRKTERKSSAPDTAAAGAASTRPAGDMTAAAAAGAGDGAAGKTPASRATPIRIAVESNPKTAALELDDKPVKENPFTMEPDGRDHKLTVSAPGHKPKSITFKADLSQRLQVRLDPETTAADPGKSRTGRGRRRRGHRAGRASRASATRPARGATDTGRKKVKVTTDI